MKNKKKTYYVVFANKLIDSNTYNTFYGTFLGTQDL